DFLAQLAQHGVARVLVRCPPAARQPPAARITQLHQYHAAFGRQGKPVRAERPRPAHEPAKPEERMQCGNQEAKNSVEHGVALTSLRAQRSKSRTSRSGAASEAPRRAERAVARL